MQRVGQLGTDIWEQGRLCSKSLVGAQPINPAILQLTAILTARKQALSMVRSRHLVTGSPLCAMASRGAGRIASQHRWRQSRDERGMATGSSVAGPQPHLCCCCRSRQRRRVPPPAAPLLVLTGRRRFSWHLEECGYSVRRKQIRHELPHTLERCLTPAPFRPAAAAGTWTLCAPVTACLSCIAAAPATSLMPSIENEAEPLGSGEGPALRASRPLEHAWAAAERSMAARQEQQSKTMLWLASGPNGRPGAAYALLNSIQTFGFYQASPCKYACRAPYIEQKKVQQASGRRRQAQRRPQLRHAKRRRLPHTSLQPAAAAHIQPERLPSWTAAGADATAAAAATAAAMPCRRRSSSGSMLVCCHQQLPHSLSCHRCARKPHRVQARAAGQRRRSCIADAAAAPAQVNGFQCGAKPARSAKRGSVWLATQQSEGAQHCMHNNPRCCVRTETAARSMSNPKCTTVHKDTLRAAVPNLPTSCHTTC